MELFLSSVFSQSSYFVSNTICLDLYYVAILDSPILTIAKKPVEHPLGSLTGFYIFQFNVVKIRI